MHMELELGALGIVAIGIVFNAGMSWQTLSELREWKRQKDGEDKERDQKIAALEALIG